jgi:hypothetical protein
MCGLSSKCTESGEKRRGNGRMALEAGTRESWAEFEKGRVYKGKEMTKGRGKKRLEAERPKDGKTQAGRQLPGRSTVNLFFFF